MGTPNDLGQAPLYNGLYNHNEYEFFPGTCVLPLAEDPPTDPAALADYSPVVVGRLHAPYRVRTQHFAAAKQNGPPVVPAPVSQGAFELVEGQLGIVTSMNPTGSLYDWTVSGSYTWVETCVSRVQDGFVLGMPAPFSTAPEQAAAQANGTQNAPAVGAVAQAGPAAQAGYALGNVIAPQSYQPGSTNGTGMLTAWVYPLAAFLPGNFFNDALSNGGGV